MQLRVRLCDAVRAEEFKAAAILKAQFHEGASSMPPAATPEQEAILTAGRNVVPGVCFVHRQLHYRGVVVGCEPYNNTTEAWKKVRRANPSITFDRGETQPFYHCLVDTHDRPVQSTFVAEENVQTSAEAYPVAHPGCEQLLVAADSLAGYLPSPRLEGILNRQRLGDRFGFFP